MPQTKFVLRKSLDLGLKPMVVINKIDKKAARPEEVKEMIYELFLDLGANDEQLNFTTLYAIAREGIAKKTPQSHSKSLTPLLDLILAEVPPASSSEAKAKPLLIQPFNLAYDNFLGRLAIGRIYAGTIRQADSVVVKTREGTVSRGKITKLFTFEGINRKEVESASAGDIIMLAGLPDIYIGETICANEEQEALPAISIDEPTISLNFLVNNSPFAGQDGQFVTNRQLRQRLIKELEVNVGLKIDFSSTDYYTVFGRGEMHIAILLENLRREGYELQISQPQAIIKEIGGQQQEPFEEVTILVPNELTGIVIEKLSKRRGTMIDLRPEHGQIRMIFEVPTRGLLGYKNEFIIDTRGQGILYSRVIGFRPRAGSMEKGETGSMVSMATGQSSGFALFNLQERGALFIGAGVDVYEGMVVGNAAKGRDMEVNPTKGKNLTNMRSKSADEAIRLTTPLTLTLERGMEIMKDDEYLEITPKNIRLRKKYLTENERVKARR